MAMEVNQFIVGIDVAKAELVVHFQDSGTQMSLTNTKPEIKKWLRQQPANTALCVEATNVLYGRTRRGGWDQKPASDC
ncbi:hypothetical protein ACP3TY_13090 [Pseudomonas rustica]|uniref:hypothetical protein n=1 Tax=Pseudomonas rustica TaxID=2827099 RepID=UPI003CE91ABB